VFGDGWDFSDPIPYLRLVHKYKVALIVGAEDDFAEKFNFVLSFGFQFKGHGRAQVFDLFTVFLPVAVERFLYADNEFGSPITVESASDIRHGIKGHVMAEDALQQFQEGGFSGVVFSGDKAQDREALVGIFV